jgi:hypothetical protein
MALTIYKSLAPYALSISTLDLSGQRPTTVSIPAGEVFMGDDTDPLVANLLASGAISFVAADANGVANGSLFNWNEGGEYVALVQVGTHGAELVLQLYQAYYEYWRWC